MGRSGAMHDAAESKSGI